MAKKTKHIIGIIISMFIVVLIYLVQDIQRAICPVHRIGKKEIKKNIFMDC